VRRWFRDLLSARRIVPPLIVVAAALSLTLTASGEPTSPTSARFVSSSRNVSCEMADGDARGSFVHCQSKRLPHSVRMTPTGRLRVCRGESCLGDPATNARVLDYTQRITVGRFQCVSRHAGVKCTVIQSGKGFLIDNVRVRRVGAAPASRHSAYRTYQLPWPSRARQTFVHELRFHSAPVRAMTLSVYGITVPRGLGTSYIVACMDRDPAFLNWDWRQIGRAVHVTVKMTTGRCFNPGPKVGGTSATVTLSIVT
jgi:hypothetical protein